VAKTLGLSERSVGVKRRGDVAFSFRDLELLAPLFGMTPGELVDGNVVYVDFVHRGPRVDLRQEKTGATMASEPVAENEDSPAAGAAGESGVLPTGVD